MSTGFTPGPWRIKTWSDDEAFVVACNPENGKDMHVTMTAMRGDASLIAAAPDLYEALEALEETVVALFRAATPAGNYGNQNAFADKNDAVCAARAALAKARGE